MCTVTPEPPKAAPSAVIGADRLPVVPVDAVEGSTVKYTIGGFENEFVNDGETRFYIDTHTGNAYRDKDCTVPLGQVSTGTNGKKAVLEISSVLDGVESDTNRYTYSLSGDGGLAPPYADKETGNYEERKIDENNNLLAVQLDSLNTGGTIEYRLDNSGKWNSYDGNPLLLKEDTILQVRYEKNGKYSTVVSYVYHFVPLPPMIALPSGTYLESDHKTTTISLDSNAPTDKKYSIWYRQNGDDKDVRYMGQEREITHTMSFKAYVRNEETGRVSTNTIHYYIIEKAGTASGSVYIAYPYDTERIAAQKLGTGDYAEGIKLLTQNKSADIHYYYTYTKKADGQTITTNTEIYDITHPIIPTELMDDITIHAWLEDENGRIQGSDGTFYIDFIHLNVPETSLGSEQVEFPRNTSYTLINEYPDDKNIILYYTTDGSDPTDDTNENRSIYTGETLKLTKAVTVKAAYYSVCGKCVACKGEQFDDCWYPVYGPVGTYKYTVPSGGGGGGGGSGFSPTPKPTTEPSTVDHTRKYTKDIFGNEHPTHIGYINGYPDGSVQPGGPITREEMTAILYRITNHAYEKPFAATGRVSPDVKDGRWSLHDIEYMADKKIVVGYPDGEFKPSRHLTRAEFAALIHRFTKLEEATEKENPFRDLQEKHWAYEAILALCESGLMEGYEDESFRPESSITRAEVMTVINKILGRKPIESYVKSLSFNPYNDLEMDKWYYVIVLEATITHDYWLDNEDYEHKWENWK